MCVFLCIFLKFQSARGLVTGAFRTRPKSLEKELQIRAKSPGICQKETHIFEKKPECKCGEPWNMSKRDLYPYTKTAKHVKRDMYLCAKRRTVCQKKPMCVCKESQNVSKTDLYLYAKTVKHDMGWLRQVRSLKGQVSFAEEPYKTDLCLYAKTAKHDMGWLRLVGSLK